MLTQSIYEKIGGDDAISAIVDVFYKNVLQDERISHFFKHIDIDRLKKHQSKFLCFAFGGYGHYPNNYLRNTHQNLVQEHGLNEMHFMAVAENLETALKECQIDETYTNMIMVVVRSVKEDVLGL